MGGAWKDYEKDGAGGRSINKYSFFNRSSCITNFNKKKVNKYKQVVYSS